MEIDILIAISAYLLGSLSSAVIICKIFAAPDPRELGSKNPGATNVLRVAGRLPAALTLLADGLKGFIPTLLAFKFAPSPLAAPIALFSVVLGHILPLFFKFKGGKGVATAYGAFIGLDPLFGGIIFLSWFLILKLSKVSSLAAVISCVEAAILAIYWFNTKPIVISIIAVCTIVLLRHQSNIRRLINNNELKIS
jgi:glycerol-3-phosphate acyltransferase PlsY